MTTDRVMFRRGTAAQWRQANPVLAIGEPGYETDTHQLKIGDGVKRWVDLHYILLDHRLFTTKVAFGSTAPVAPAPGSVWIHSTDGSFPDIPPPPTPQAFSDSVTFSGSGTLTGGARVRYTGAATLSGSGSLTASGSTAFYTGVGYTQYENVFKAGMTFRQVLAAVPSGNILVLPAGIYELVDFTDPTGYHAAARLPVGLRGIYGRNIDPKGGQAAVIRLRAGSSTQSAYTDVNGVNPLRVLEIVYANTWLKNLQFYGTDQGHNYNGVQFSGSSTKNVNNCGVDNCFFWGIGQGTSGAPPGETFMLGTNHTDDFQILNSEFDGRNPATNVPWTGSNIGWNNHANAFMQNVNTHHSGFGGGLTFYRINNIHTINTISNVSNASANTAINHEDCSGAVLHENTTVFIDYATRQRGHHLTFNVSGADGYGNDPNVSFTNITHDAGPAAGCLMLQIGLSYGGHTEVQTSFPTITKNGITLTARDNAVSGWNTGLDPNRNYVVYR